MKRTVEFVLGLLGGIFGIIGAVITLFIGGIGSAFNADGADTIIGLGWVAVLFSVLAIIGSVIVKNKAKPAGIMFLIAGIGGIICISMYYMLPGILLIIAGVLSLVKKDKHLPKEGEVQ